MMKLWYAEHWEWATTHIAICDSEARPMATSPVQIFREPNWSFPSNKGGQPPNNKGKGKGDYNKGKKRDFDHGPGSQLAISDGKMNEDSIKEWSK